MTRLRNQTPRSRGFSLLELVLAMAMAAMLALSLYTAFNVATRAHRTAMRAVEPIRAGSIAMDIVQRDFESVPPPLPADNINDLRLNAPFYGQHQPAGAGDNDTVAFCSIGADPIDAGADVTEASPLSEGTRRIEYFVTTDGAEPALIRRVTRNLMPAMEAHAEDEVLVRGVRSFSLRYYNGTSWQEDWDSTTLDDSLPFSVAITLDLGDANADAPAKRVTRVVPLACAKPLATDTSFMEGMQ